MSSDAATGRASALSPQSVRARIHALIERPRMARRLFMDAQGNMTPDAIMFFGLLADYAKLGDLKMAPDARTETWRAAQRALVLFAMSLADIDEGRLLTAKKTLQELEDQEDE